MCSLTVCPKKGCGGIKTCQALTKAEKMKLINNRAQIWTVTEDETSSRIPGPLFDEANQWAAVKNRTESNGEVLPINENVIRKLIKEEYSLIKQSMENLSKLGVDAIFTSVFQEDHSELANMRHDFVVQLNDLFHQVYPISTAAIQDPTHFYTNQFSWNLIINKLDISVNK